jgi:hypothetical protein
LQIISPQYRTIIYRHTSPTQEHLRSNLTLYAGGLNAVSPK